MSAPKILRYPQVIEITGLNRSKIEDLSATGKFPKGVKLTTGGRAVGFFSDEVASYVEWRRAERDGLTKETWKKWHERREKASA